METEAADGDSIEHCSSLKTGHGRKQLYQAIQERMEFYFSDANLSKDRFMTNLLNEDPQIDLSVFLKFNKVNALTTDVKDIAKALKKSTLLSLTDDKTKVFRKVPVKVKENVDECTLYVEQLPIDADHDWLRSIFSQFGKIDYVSVPKFRNSAKIKGFAFIEFATPEGAKNALDAFTNAGCKLPSTILPNQLLSIATFDRNEKDVIRNRKMLGLSSENIKSDSEATDASKAEKKHLSKKRPHELNSSSLPNKKVLLETSEEEIVNEDKPTKIKRKHVKIDESLNSCDEAGGDESIGKSKRTKIDKSQNSHAKMTEGDSDINESSKVSSVGMYENDAQWTESGEAGLEDSANENSEQNASNSGEASQKKRRKKKKKKVKKSKSDLASSGLQVLSKCEWKKLRNKYLELQRAKMNSLKQYLAKIKYDDDQHIMQIKTEDKVENEEKANVTKSISSVPRVQYTPGVILKLIFEEPVVDVKAFKTEVKSHAGVEYVDVSEGAFVAFVRCSSTDVTKQLNSEKLGNSSSILEGDDEKSYWEKILKDREEKLTKSLRVNQKGRNKLLKKAEKALGKRIRFDSD